MLLKDYLNKPVREDYTKAPNWNAVNIVPPATMKEEEKILPPAAPTTKEGVDLPKPIWQRTPVVKEATGRSAEQVRNANPQTADDAYNGIAERLNNGEDVFKVLLDRKYNDSKQDIERQRKASLLGDLATLFGQSVSLAKGARQFSPIQSKVPYYNEQLQKLKDWRNNADINYSLSQAKNDYDMKKYQQKLNLDKYKMDVQQGQFGENMKLKYAKLAEDVRKNRITQEQADERLKETMRHNGVMEGVASDNASSSRISAEAAKERAAKAGNKTSNESMVVTDGSGNKTAVTYPKEKRGAIISLYNRMKELSAVSPGKYGGVLDDVNLQFGESGDQASKAMTIIQRRLQDFPELTDEFYRIIGNSPTSARSLLPNSTISSGSLLPQ